MIIDKRHLIETATARFQETTGLAVYADPPAPDGHTDGVIRIERRGDRWQLAADVRLHLTRERLGMWAAQRPGPTGGTVLITDYVHPALATKLKDMDIAFMDTAGNAYVNLPGLYVFMKGNGKPEGERRNPTHRAFKPAGLRILYAFLCNPGLENRTYRDIAAAAGVALGTVAQTVNDLLAQGRLVDTKHHRRVRNRRDLFMEWVMAYPHELRPKLLIGRYAAKDDAWWKNPTPGLEGALWGGEPAAARLTGHLLPATATIYVRDRLNSLIVAHGLQRDPRGRVELLHAFWQFEPPHPAMPTVHPLLVYADLIATADPRNLETARIIDDTELARYLGDN